MKIKGTFFHLLALLAISVSLQKACAQIQATSQTSGTRTVYAPSSATSVFTAIACQTYRGINQQICSQPASITLLAQKQTPTVTLASTPTNIIPPQTLACTANVSGGATGSVVFTANGGTWTTVPLTPSGSATASKGLASAKQAVYTILASYSGDSVNNAASATATVRLNPPVSSWLPAVLSLLGGN